ncbi:MAG: hypothetical protein KF901_23430 [Myxococcales bacterium]|nr:hypothetical protein [Myxococcales bacterium]
MSQSPLPLPHPKRVEALAPGHDPCHGPGLGPGHGLGHGPGLGHRQRRSNLRRCALTLAILSLSTLATAQAPTEAPVEVEADDSARARAERHLADGRRLYRELDFPGCVDAMHRALGVPGVTAAQRLEAFEMLGAAYVVLDREQEAAAAFREMFRLDPYHRVREPSGSPKIERFVEELRATLVPDAALDPNVELRALLPAAARVGRPVPVRVEVEGPRVVARVEVRQRPDDEREWRSVALRPSGDAFEGELPAPSGRGRLELYAEGRNSAGQVVTRAGEPLVPIVLEVRERDAEQAVPLRRRWWVWAAVGVAVVASAVVVGVVASRSERAPQGTLPPGRVELP